jgi:hypothetical protein
MIFGGASGAWKIPSGAKSPHYRWLKTMRLKAPRQAKYTLAGDPLKAAPLQREAAPARNYL